MTNKFLKQLIFVLIVSNLIVACSTVPITNRSQLNLFPESQMIQTSLTSYQDFLSKAKISNNKSQTALVKKVGNRIAKAVDTYLRENGMSASADKFKWEFNLVEDNTPNAWCMPGGKVVVYTGILPYTQNEEGLAVVLGHEIAHAVARHGNERMSQQMGMQAASVGLQVALAEKPAKTKQLWMTAFGVGAQYGVILPFSRQHESEADKMGLVFMTLAGYNPEAAVNFWTRMSQSGGQKPPEFLSTHPSDKRRIAQIKKYLPEAKKYKKH